MTDETPENEIEVEKDDDREEPETENTEETSEDNENDRPFSPRPYIRYTSMPRRGSIWNSPLGLLTTFLIASKAIDLAYRAMIEREKTKRAANQKQQ